MNKGILGTALLAVPFATLIAVAQQESQPAAGDAPRAKLESTSKAAEAKGVEAANSQKNVDKTDDETRTLLDEYRLALRKLENTKAYNEQLRTLIASQKAEMTSIQKQIEQVKDTGQEIVPLMTRMLDALDQFVAIDTPFLPEERTKRMKDLKEMMNRADVSTSEKYRRILEAFQVENEYGRTIEAYRSLLPVEGKELTVDFLRIGRLALIYQTLDGGDSAIWDTKKKAWVSLSSSYNKAINTALRVARKQMAPDLLTLPIQMNEVSL